MSLLLALLAALSALALSPPVPGQAAPLTPVSPEALRPVLPMSDALATALRDRDHATAIAELQKLDAGKLSAEQKADRDFLMAWSLVRAGRASEAAPLLDALRIGAHAPADYRQLTTGEILLADGRAREASLALEQVPATSRLYARARIAAAEAHQKAGATAESRAHYEALVARPDPAEGTDIALWALALRAGLGSPEACPLLRRAWSRYPTSEAGRNAAKELAAYEAKGQCKPRDADIAARADALQTLERHEETLTFLTPLLPRFVNADVNACTVWHATGRAMFKKNRLQDAIDLLGPTGDKCAGIDEEHGARALYIAGKALERKKQWAAAAAMYQKIPALYPGHSMADDGYTLGGIAWQEAGDTAKAMKLWEAEVKDYADGDLAAEAFWRLAWNHYLAGNTDKAIATVETMIWEVPLEHDPVHVLAGRYWSARWRLYPDVSDPRRLNDDSAARAQGLRLLAELCRDHPMSFYALLAAGRLYELDPDALAAIPRPDFGRRDDTLSVRAAFLAEPAGANGLALAALGLTREALAEWDVFPQDSLTPSELALVTRVQGQIDPVVAHNRLHHFLLEHPPSTLGPDADAVLRQAYPDLYWDELSKATADYDWDPRIFHALVREESSFNPKIVSFAGARGLSQLMPATGKEVARQMGLSVTNDQLFDPALNLKIGARYYDGLQSSWRASFYLSTASYNAGPGNVNSWLTRFGNVPVDEFVERIPLRETRHYVKRVLGTYQVYHVLYDPGPLFPNWSYTNHAAKPAAG